jgi:hypothetical protein
LISIWRPQWSSSTGEDSPAPLSREARSLRPPASGVVWSPQAAIEVPNVHYTGLDRASLGWRVDRHLCGWPPAAAGSPAAVARAAGAARYWLRPRPPGAVSSGRSCGYSPTLSPASTRLSAPRVCRAARLPLSNSPIDAMRYRTAAIDGWPPQTAPCSAVAPTLGRHICEPEAPGLLRIADHSGLTASKPDRFGVEYSLPCQPGGRPHILAA